ncbi:hypothetical protein CVD25_00690 [Bacillus canaveralius]|uniref:B3/B4 tRNA-binding domain-containing protein n=1 Tax=Bacillus canaveralius TaxID=1403243 RepID=A0A2N5GG05_9BACI|nr:MULTISPECIES: phenylalanine--tRNA ligase beta subunit-related protein [Bacillus]PLR79672.1 hypothetical protein CU635_21970 [Bacillus canaveralius]PLR80838.1 hypothetical protein CVD23_20140 [Bacillus sp. V33-4]PLS00864.1 hypothetical protein CVD25_00690 [Bacillus canaveralius]
MEIVMSPDIAAIIPSFNVGVIQYHGIVVGESPQMLKGRFQLFQESIFFDLENKNVTDLEGIQEWRQIFKKTGIDPNRYRPSAEALYRRIKKQNYINSVNSAIDLNNFCSLEYQVPIGIYDRNLLSGDISIRLGGKGEEYFGLNGRSNSLANLIISADQNGPFGSPFVDSTRTAVGPETTSAVQIIYLRPSLDKENQVKLTEAAMNMFLQLHGGTAKYEVIGC